MVLREICTMKWFATALLLVSTTVAGAVADSSGCNTCFDRSVVRLGVVTHGAMGDPFWTTPMMALQQSARDMIGTTQNLELLPLAAEDASEEEIEATMVQTIQELCGNDEAAPKVDGLITTIPSSNSDLTDAMETCLSSNIPVIVFNAGESIASSFHDEYSNELLHFVGQDEYAAGHAAGSSLVKTCPLCFFYCANHAPDVDVVVERCTGFQDAIQELNGTFVSSIEVNTNNITEYQMEVEAAVGLSDGNNSNTNWDNIGLLLAGQANHVPGLAVQEAHPGLILGAIDVSSVLYEALEDGRIQFGVDQQAFMQASLPIPLMMWYLQAEQTLQDFMVDTRSGLITDAPDSASSSLADNNNTSCSNDVLQVCQSIPTDEDINEESSSASAGLCHFSPVLASLAAFFWLWQ